MRIIKWIFIFCFFHFSVIAQQNFDHGYIVNHNKDTVKGLIKTVVEADLSESVFFKKEINDEWTEYGATDLSGFGFDNETYRSFRFHNTSRRDTIDTKFAKQLVSGEYNLFTYNKAAVRFFLLQKDTIIYQLYDELFENSGQVYQVANYQNYLNFISVPCDKLKNKYLQIAYDEKSISDFVQEANNCISGGSSVSYYQKQKVKITAVIFAGALPLSGQNSQVAANFAIRMTLPHVDNHLSLNIGLNYSSTTFKSPDNAELNPAYQYYTKSQITSIPVTVQYNLTQSRIQPYFYLGFSFAHLISDNLATGFWVQRNEDSSGFALVAGLGVEARIIYQLYIRADWRYELIAQYPVIGLSYHF